MEDNTKNIDSDNKLFIHPSYAKKILEYLEKIDFYKNTLTLLFYAKELGNEKRFLYLHFLNNYKNHFYNIKIYCL